MPKRLAIIGGDAAGMSAAATARRRDPDLEIVAFERGGHTSYSACGIPYYVAEHVADIEALVARSPDEHRANGIEVHTRCEVTEIDLAARTLTVCDLASRTERDEPFDELMIATGAVATPPDIPGIEDTEPARTLEAGQRFRAQLSLGGHHGVVIGGGYIGIEMAEAMVHRGMRVTIVERSAQLMGTMDPDMAAHVQDGALGIGIDVRLSVDVEEILLDADGEPRAVQTSEGEIRAEHIVLATGVKPEVALAEAAGLTIGASGALAVDDRQSAADGVWAAGDCVESLHRLLGKPVNIQLGTHANKQGRIAGTNLTGGDLRFPGVIGTAISRVCEREVALSGLTEADAKDAGFDVVAVTIDTETRAGYMPESGPMWVKLVAEKGSGRLLGAQIVGAETAGKRIDVLALAIWNGMPVDELQWVDLSYAPPVSGVLDPVLVAARATAKAL